MKIYAKHRILTTLALGVMTGSSFTLAQAAPKAATKTAPQKVTITLPEGYKDNATTVKAGKPVALTFFLKSDAGCGNTVKVPAAKWEKTLKIGQKATVTFTPKKSGPLAFACSMDHMKGSLKVK
jgi:plastocyanin domain-containing protein